MGDLIMGHRIVSTNPVTTAVGILLSVAIFTLAWAQPPSWVAYPCNDWETATPQEAGITNVSVWKSWVAKMEGTLKGASFYGEQHPGNEWGVVITRGGYLLHEFGDGDYKFQTSSVGKAFTMAVFQLALDKGIIKNENDLVKDYWTGAGYFNSPHKNLNSGHHNFLTFKHLDKHVGGFPLTNGHTWKLSCKNYNKAAPAWAKCTNDPDYDNYSHTKPPASMVYSSGGYWRFGQVLTAVWKKDMKDVLDEHLFGKMGIRPEDWSWTPGKVPHDDRNWYPEMTYYGLMLDPPYMIDGDTVRGAPGWVVMSAKNLARFALLVGTRGYWRGEKLIGTKYLSYHAGGNGCDMRGVHKNGEYFAIGQVTATPRATDPGGVIGPRFNNSPHELFVKPVSKVTQVPECKASAIETKRFAETADSRLPAVASFFAAGKRVSFNFTTNKGIDRVSIYDSRGRLEKMFSGSAIQRLADGNARVEWQRSPNAVNSGVWIVRVHSGNMATSHKVVLM